MVADEQNRELERQYKALLFTSRLPDAALSPGAPPALRLIDHAFARALFGDEIWGGDDRFDERNRLSRDILPASSEGQRLLLSSAIDLLTQSHDGRTELCHQGPFGLREWVFPIRLRGRVVHLVRSGAFRESPMIDTEIRELNRLTGVDEARIRDALQSLPIHSATSSSPEAVPLRALRDARQTALELHLDAREASLRQLASEKQLALGTMAEGAAQHVNNLLSLVLGYGSLLSALPDLPAGSDDLLRKINDAAQRGRRFTQELLALATSGDEESVILSLHDQVQSVVQSLHARIAGRVKVQFDLHAREDRVAAPPAVLHQALFNLVTNALDGMSAGGLLVITSADQRDDQGLQQVLLELSDTGGTPPAGPARKTGKAGRTLSTMGEVPPRMMGAFGLIARLDGSIEVLPEDSLTTRVRVLLPIRTERVDSSARKPGRRRLTSSEIWVADDDSVIRDLCRRILVEDGHQVTEIGTGDDLFRQLGTGGRKPDLIVYDFSMPDLDGFEFCSRLRSQGMRIPVLLLSGLKADQPHVREALKLRKTFLLEKPFSFRDMTDQITVALGETLLEE